MVHDGDLEPDEPETEQAVGDPCGDCGPQARVSLPPDREPPGEELEDARGESEGLGGLRPEEPDPAQAENDGGCERRLDDGPLGPGDQVDAVPADPPAAVDPLAEDLRPGVREPEDGHRPEQGQRG